MTKFIELEKKKYDNNMYFKISMYRKFKKKLMAEEKTKMINSKYRSSQIEEKEDKCMTNRRTSIRAESKYNKIPDKSDE